MPFKSKAQQRLCWSKYNRAIERGEKPEWDCHEWSKETNNKTLPYYTNSNKSKQKRDRLVKELLNTIEVEPINIDINYVQKLIEDINRNGYSVDLSCYYGKNGYNYTLGKLVVDDNGIDTFRILDDNNIFSMDCLLDSLVAAGDIKAVIAVFEYMSTRKRGGENTTPGLLLLSAYHYNKPRIVQYLDSLIGPNSYELAIVQAINKGYYDDIIDIINGYRRLYNNKGVGNDPDIIIRSALRYAADNNNAKVVSVIEPMVDDSFKRRIIRENKYSPEINKILS